MAEHTVIGERIISRIAHLRSIGHIVRAAHERWDGSGYPGRPRRRRDPPAVAHPAGLRRLSRHDLGPSLSRGAGRRRRSRGATAERRDAVRPRGRRTLPRDVATLRDGALRGGQLGVAEREGFEPSKRQTTLNGFRDRRFQPSQPPLREGLRTGLTSVVAGGEGGIRTHEAACRRPRDFQSRSLSQLGHLSGPVREKRSIAQGGVLRERSSRAGTRLPVGLAAAGRYFSPASRRRLKNSCRSATDSSSSTRLRTSVKWFRRGSRAMSKTVPAAPAFSSRAP